MKNIIDRIRNWRSTAAAIVPAVLAILVALGYIDVNFENTVLENYDGIFDGVIAILSAVAAIVGAVSKDK